MTQEYEAIREGLLALLCIGDQINYIHSGIGGFNRTTGENEPYHTILRYYVIDVIGPGIIKIGNYGSISTVLPTAIEMYNGELYVWHNSSFTSYPTRKERIAKMTEIIKSKIAENISLWP
jgi:uncharacterized protein (UPF0261 family)